VNDGLRAQNGTTDSGHLAPMAPPPPRHPPGVSLTCARYSWRMLAAVQPIMQESTQGSKIQRRAGVRCGASRRGRSSRAADRRAGEIRTEHEDFAWAVGDEDTSGRESWRVIDHEQGHVAQACDACWSKIAHYPWEGLEVARPCTRCRTSPGLSGTRARPAATRGVRSTMSRGKSLRRVTGCALAFVVSDQSGPRCIAALGRQGVRSRVGCGVEAADWIDEQRREGQ
jgi:hypothetical protein